MSSISKLNFQNLDVDELDFDDPVFSDIAEHLIVHSRAGRLQPKFWIATGLLAAGELSAVFGEPGAGKSALAVDIACRVASGIDWHGRATGAYNVVYVAAERKEQVRRRVDAFCVEHGIAGRLDNLAIYGGPIDLSESSSQLRAIVRAAEFAFVPGDYCEAGFVIIDTLAAAMSRPDSDTAATAAAVGNLLATVNSGERPHVMIVHHQPLSGERRLRGGHLTGAMDVTIHVARKGGHVVAQVVKDNDTPDGDRLRLTYTMKSVPLECADGSTVSAPVVVPCEAKDSSPETDPEPQAITAIQQAVLDALLEASDGGPVTVAEWRARYNANGDADVGEGTRKRRFYRAKDTLEANGLAFQDGDLWSACSDTSDTSDISDSDIGNPCHS